MLHMEPANLNLVPWDEAQKLPFSTSILVLFVQNLSFEKPNREGNNF